MLVSWYQGTPAPQRPYLGAAISPSVVDMLRWNSWLEEGSWGTTTPDPGPPLAGADPGMEKATRALPGRGHLSRASGPRGVSGLWCPWEGRRPRRSYGGLPAPNWAMWSGWGRGDSVCGGGGVTEEQHSTGSIIAR